MKKGFTLVELLVVVVVLVTLMAIVFRLSNIGGDLAARNTTIQRMQRLENCLSGYFAAYGSYPPVALYATHNVYQRVDDFGDQEDAELGSLDWGSVNAVCKAQPFGCRFPFNPSLEELVVKVSQIMAARANSGDPHWAAYAARREVLSAGFHTITNPNQVDGWSEKGEWSEVKIFQFGLMSYLLPRYMTMSTGLDADDLQSCKQWTDSNEYACNPNTGAKFSSWKDQLEDKRLVKRIPSQAVCARWMPNLQGIVNCTSTTGKYDLFGVNVSSGSACSINPDNVGIELYEGNGTRYVLDSMSISDGWGNDFYYYSPPPYQSYRLWSAGTNGKTFPPWIPLNTLKSDNDKKLASNWMADDILYQNN